MSGADRAERMRTGLTAGIWEIPSSTGSRQILLV
jgi:hypothetical protein